MVEKVHADNQKREMVGLLEAMAFFGKTEGFILTLDQADSFSTDGKSIHSLPAEDFLRDYIQELP